MKVAVLAAALLFVSACDGSGENAGDASDNVSDGEDPLESGPAETMGKHRDEAADAAEDARDSRADALEDRAETIDEAAEEQQETARQQAEALEQQAERVRAIEPDLAQPQHEPGWCRERASRLEQPPSRPGRDSPSWKNLYIERDAVGKQFLPEWFD